MKKFAALIILLFPVFASAQQAQHNETTLEPEVRIVEPGGSLIEEFRSGGRTYMIKITPKKGRPYYLVDADGDGDLDTHRNDNAPRLLIPSWVIFSW